MRSFSLAIGVIAISLSLNVSATLVSVDLLTPGDGYVTRDDANELDWLDVDLTTRLSVDDINVNTGGWVGMGFRYATSTELRSLLIAAGVSETTGWVSLGETPWMSDLLDLIGITYTGTEQYETYGLLADTHKAGSNTSIHYSHLAYNASSTQAIVYRGSFTDSRVYDSLVGSFLVRDVVAVSAPATEFIFALVLLLAAVGYRSTTADAGAPIWF